MTLRSVVRTGRISAVAALFAVAAAAAAVAQDAARAPLMIDSARISIAGTTNVHEYTAWTTTVRMKHLQLSGPVAGVNAWDAILAPGALQTFEIAVPAATLTSPKGELDKNMHKALQVEKFPDITFRLRRLEPAAGGALNAIGTLTITGTERDVTLALKTKRSDATLTVSGTLSLLMTDYGITPPKAMLGMLKTDPKVTLTFEAVLALPLL